MNRKSTGGRKSSKTPTKAEPQQAAPKPGDNCLDAPVLEAASQIFRLASTASGAAAIVYQHIQRHRLFEKAGHKGMHLYAAAVLGISSKSNRAKFSRAGKAAWEYYRSACDEALAHLAQGLTPVHPEFPQIPGVTTLSLLPRALKNMPEPEKKALLERVMEPDFRTHELEQLAKKKSVEVPVTASPPSAESVPRYIERAVKLMNEADSLLRVGKGASADGSRSKQLLEHALETLTASIHSEIERPQELDKFIGDDEAGEPADAGDGEDEEQEAA